MQETYGTDPADLLACIGPGICADHFEVGDEVFEAFAAAGFDMNRVAKRINRWHIDLPLCNEETLLSCGLRPENIHQSRLCTFERNETYFSARRQGINSGRIFNGILLTE